MMDRHDDLDALARRAAVELTDQAGAFADTEAGLAEILDGGPIVLSVDHGPAATPRRWWPLLAAAAVVLVVAGVVAVARNDDKRITTIPQTTPPPPASTVPASSTTSPTTTGPSTASTVAATTVPTTAPVVTDGPVPTLTDADATVLYTAAVGSESTQLGREQCTECDPQRPLAPWIASDGTMVIVDPVNQRIVLVRDGTPTAVPITGADTLWTDAAMVDDTLYGIAYQPNGAVPEHGHLAVNPLADLAAPGAHAPVSSLAIDLGTLTTRLDVTVTRTGANQVQTSSGGPVELTVVAELPAATATTVSSSQGPVWQIDVAGAATRSYRIRRSDPVAELTPLTDGSVVVTQFFQGSNGAGLLVDRLLPNGTITEELIDAAASPADLAGRWTVSTSGVTKLVYDEAASTFRVQRFPLPTTAVADIPAGAVPGTSVAPTGSAIQLGNGLAISGLREQPTKITHVESQVSNSGRTDYRAILTFPHDPPLVVVLGHDRSTDNRTQRTIEGRPGWTDPYVGVGWQVGVDTYLQLTNDITTNSGEGWTIDQLLALTGGVTWDVDFDGRFMNDPAFTEGGTGSPCGTPFRADGGGAGTLVVFTCDGDLAVLDAATGTRRETIVHYDQHSSTETGSTYVDGISFSNDGTTVYWSTGPEPLYGTWYSYRLGSHAEPTPVGTGMLPQMSADGKRMVTAAGDSLMVFTVGTLDAVTIPLYESYPARLWWSPDGTQVAFDAGHGAIGICELATGDVVIHAAGDAAASAATAWPTTSLDAATGAVGPAGAPWAVGVTAAAIFPGPAAAG